MEEKLRVCFFVLVLSRNALGTFITVQLLAGVASAGGIRNAAWTVGKHARCADFAGDPVGGANDMNKGSGTIKHVIHERHRVDVPL